MVKSKEGWVWSKDNDGCFVLTKQHTRGDKKGKVSSDMHKYTYTTEVYVHILFQSEFT